jgi:HlyD family secretion protein
MRSRHWVTLGVVVLAGALLAGVLLRLQGAGEDDGEDPATSAEDSVGREIRSEAAASAFSTEVAVPVQAARVRRDTFTLWVAAEGTAEARRRATLRAEVGGPVREAPVEEGDRVREGQLVARIDSSSYVLDLENARAEHEMARAEFRTMTLGGAEMDLDEEERRERRRQARIRSGLTQAEVELERARYELDKTRVRAPFPGLVANLTISEGARLDPQDSVATILDLSQVEVDVDVLETRITHLEEGRRARVSFTALPDETFPGRVVSINPLVDPESETVRVTVRLENPEARVLPGMHASVEVAGRRYADRVFVPRDAIVERDRRDVVFTFAPSDSASGTGRAQWKYVTTGLENEQFVEIVPDEETEMLEPGELVLVEGHTTLTHDARVRVEEWSELTDAGS